MLAAVPHRTAERAADNREHVFLRQFPDMRDGVLGEERRMHEFDAIKAGVLHVGENLEESHVTAAPSTTQPG